MSKLAMKTVFFYNLEISMCSFKMDYQLFRTRNKININYFIIYYISFTISVYSF